MNKFYVLFLLSALSMGVSAQAITQNVRGTVIDKEAGKPLDGATVTILKDSTLIGGTVTDEKGNFRVGKVPVGRVNVVISYLGYKRMYMPNVLVNSGKEPVLTCEMESSIEAKTEVVVDGKKRGETINEMAVLSNHAFTVEETDRYAGSRSDPARMASNFAGVSGTDDSKNDLVIRGNSPFGVMYRVDNIAVPTPNHFAIAGATGGSVAILNNRMLNNSDFFTGAFTSEYGNATAGVFDIRMKNGNNQRHEFTAQIGFLGAELFGEGPLGKKGASYMVNGRYATLQGLSALGFDLGTKAVPKYQDVQFKLNFPFKNGDNLSMFAIGGTSHINFLTSPDKTVDNTDIYATPDQDEYFRAGIGVVGLTYLHRDNDHAYSKISLGASTQFNGDDFYRINRTIDSAGNYSPYTSYQKNIYTMYNTRYTASYMRNDKVSARSALRYGMVTEMYQPYMVDRFLQETTYNPELSQNTWITRMEAKNQLHFLMQPYFQWKYAVSEKVSIVSGMHGQYFTLNNRWSAEPRFNIKYQFKPNQSLAFATGLYSQTVPMYQYFVQDATGNKYNKNLDFIRSFQAVAGYDVFFKKDIRIKVEAYYQLLYGLGVDTFSSSYNILNEGNGFDRFFPGKLNSTGMGRNMGVEFTLEKFFTHNWFIMFNASLYDSRLQGSNGKYYNSDFNGQYITNVLGTKEFKWGKKRINTFGIGGKVTFGGGQRYTPYDTILSPTKENGVKIDAQRNQGQFKPYFRFDVKLNYKVNSHRFTHEIGVDLVNVTGEKNVLRMQYFNSQNVQKPLYQLGFMPLFYYRLDFWLGKKNW